MKKIRASKGGTLTTGDLDKIAGLLDDRIAPLATKEEIRPLATKVELNELEDNLKGYMNEGFDAVMEGIDNLAAQMAEKEKVDRLVVWAKKVAPKVGIRVDI